MLKNHDKPKHLRAGLQSDCSCCTPTGGPVPVIAVMGKPVIGMLNFWDVTVTTEDRLKRYPHDQIFKAVDWTRTLVKFLMALRTNKIRSVDITIDQEVRNRVPDHGIWKGLLDRMDVQVEGGHFRN